MKFLEELGFDSKIIIEFEKEVPQPIKTKIIDYQTLVSDNIKYLKEIGVKNYTEAFINYYDMFLIDSTNFQEIFEKYDRDDLIDKLQNNLAIIEHL